MDFSSMRYYDGSGASIDFLKQNLLEDRNISFRLTTPFIGERVEAKKIKAKVLKKYDHHVLCKVYGEFGGKPWLECFQYFDLIKGGWKYGL